MLAKLDNPAGRLLDLIVSGKQLKPETECRLAWCELLGIDPSDTPALMMRVGKAMALLDEIKTAVHACKNIRPETYLNFMDTLEKAFQKQRFTDQWASFISYIDNNTISFMEITSDMLSMQQSEGVVSVAALNEVQKDLDALVKEISTSKIEADIKEFMTRRLRTVQIAVDEYRLTGMRGLYEAVYAVVGELSSNSHLEEALKKTYIGKKFGELVAKIFFVLNIPKKKLKVPEPLMSLLPESDFVLDDKDIVEI